ncbi:MAG: HAD-IIIA family hydrolase [Eisenbergiella sp.]
MNTEVNYLHNPGIWSSSRHRQAVKLLNGAGFAVIVVTIRLVWQEDITEADVEALHNYMNNLLKDRGRCGCILLLLHHPEHGIGRYKMTCRCRKPGTGMFEAAARELPGGIDRENSWMIGDKLIDTEAGQFRNQEHSGRYGYGSKIRKEQEAAEADAGRQVYGRQL